MTDFDKFKEKFYSSLTDRKITDKDYEQVINFERLKQ